MIFYYNIERLYRKIKNLLFTQSKTPTAPVNKVPFTCNMGCNCPWTEESREYGFRQKCLKCGILSAGSGQ